MKKLLNVNNVEICIDDTFEGEKIVLLLHGLTGSKEGMYSVRDLLSDDYRVITVDLRGHGESTRPSEYYLEDHADDIHEIIREMDLGKVNLLGYSMGSYIALRTAEKYCEDIDHLILLCTKANGKTSSIARILKEENLDITQLSQDELMEVISTATVAPQTFEKMERGEFDLNVLLNSGEVRELSGEEKAAEDASIANFNNTCDYDKVNCKTLVIAAEYDRINPPELGREVADGIKDAKYELINDAGHMVIFEKPEELQKVVKDFLIE